ncbi:MAG: hypothetical protein ACREB8_03320 [Pseudolabrys sp.]
MFYGIRATAITPGYIRTPGTTGSVLGADGGQEIGYFLSVPGRRFSGGRIDLGEYS